MLINKKRIFIGLKGKYIKTLFILTALSCVFAGCGDSGSSVIDNERFKLLAQAKAMAIRGATVIAQRNLLEIINGVNILMKK